MQNKCAACSKSLAGLTPFNKLQFKYCSINCVKVKALRRNHGEVGGEVCCNQGSFRFPHSFRPIKKFTIEKEV